jgi:DNA-binding winged helix-turn-helix (wHTH) protein
MMRWKQVTWKHCIIGFIGLAIVVGGAAGAAVHVEIRGKIADARDESLTTAVRFAEAAEAWIGSQAAEAWIDVDARQAFQGVVQLMLLGSATYVQLVHEAAVVVNVADEGWSSAVPLHVSEEVPEAEAAFVYSAGGRFLSDVSVPLESLNPGARNGPTSYARVGFELRGLRGRIDTIRLFGAEVAVAAFISACVAAAVVLAWLDHRSVLVTPLHGVTRSLSGLWTRAPLVLDERAKRVTVHGKAVFLPPKPFQLLCLLVREKGGVLGEKEIVGRVWPEADLADSRDVRQCVYMLRKRIDAVVAGAGACIANVKGFGYRYDAATLEGLRSEPEPEAATSP